MINQQEQEALIPQEQEEGIVPDSGEVKPLTPSMTDEGLRSTVLLGALAQTGIDPNASLDNIENLISEQAQLIGDGYEDHLRERLSTARDQWAMERNNELAAELLANPSLSDDHVNDVQALVEDTNRRAMGEKTPKDKYVIEDEGSKQLVNWGIVSDEQTAAQRSSVSLTQDVEDLLFKRAVFNRKREQAYQEFSEQSLLGKAADVATLILNPISGVLARVGNTDNASEDKSIVNFTEKYKQEMATIYAITDKDEYVQAVDSLYEKIREDSALIGVNPLRTFEILDEMMTAGFFVDTGNREVLTLTNVGVVGDVASIVAAPFEMVRTISKLAKMAGAEKTIAASAVQKINAVEGTAQQTASPISGVISNKETADALLPSAFRPDVADSGVLPVKDVGLSAATQRQLEINQAVLDSVKELPVASRLTPQEIETLKERAVRQVKNKYASKPADIEFVPSEGTFFSDVNKVRLTYGTSEGTGYAHKNEAIAKAKRLGFAEEDINVIQDLSGKWFVTKEEVVSDIGIIRAKNYDDTIGWIRSKVFSTADVLKGSNLYQRGLMSNQQMNNVISNYVRPVVEDTLGKLNKKEFTRVEEMLELSRQEEKWFGIKELKAKGLTEKEIVGYQGARMISDLDYKIRAYDSYVNLARQGIKKFEFKVAKGTEDTSNVYLGKRINNSNDINPNSDYIYNLDKGVPMNKGTYSRETLDEYLKDNKYTVVRASQAFKVDGDPYNYVLVKTSDLVEKELTPFDSVGYVPGGHRLYEDGYFVKQASIGKRKDGTEYIENDTTHVLARTMGEAKEYIERMERARTSYNAIKKEGWTKANKDLVVGEDNPFIKAGFDSFDDFDKAVVNGVIKADTPFEAVRNGERTSFSTTYASRGAQFVDDDTLLNDPLQIYRKNNSGMNAKRGEHLLGPNGEKASTVDVMKSLSDGIQNAVRSRSFSNFMQSSIETWDSKVRHYGLNQGDNPLSSFMNGLPDNAAKKLPHKVYNKLKAEHDAIKRMLSFKTQEDRYFDAVQESIVNGIENVLGTPAGKKFKGFVENTPNPVDVAKQVAFQANLGLFDLGQVVVQAQQIAVATVIDPIAAARAVPKTLALNMMVAKNFGMRLNPAYKPFVAKMYDGWEGVNGKELQLMYEEARKSGWMDFGTSHLYLDKLSNTNLTGRAATRAGKAMETSSILFTSTELLNRVNSYAMAWERYKIANNITDLKQMSTPVAREAILADADKLTFRMTGASAAAYQKGVVSVPAQFYSFMFRTAEALFGSGFTKSEKARLVLGLGVLYGAKGYGLGEISNFISQQYYDSTGEYPNEAVLKFFTSGLFDGIMYTMSNGELATNLSSRVSPVQGIVDTVTSVFKDPAEDPTAKTVTELLLGASGVKLGQIASSFSPVDWAQQMLEAMNNEERVAITKQHLHEIAMNANSYARFTKARDIVREGEYYSRRTGQALAPANELEAYAALLGIRLDSEVFTSELLSDAASVKRANKEIATTVAKYQRDAIKALNEGDEAAANGAFVIINNIMSKYNPMEKAAIQQEVNKALGKEGLTLLEQAVTRRVLETGGGIDDATSKRALENIQLRKGNE